MTPFALSGLLILITSLSLGILVLIKTPNNFTNRLWAYFNFAIALWGLGAYKMGSTHDPQSAFLWCKISHIGIILLPVFDLHFSHYYLEVKNKRLINLIYLIGLFFLITLLSGHLVPPVKYMFNSLYYPNNPSIVYILFAFFWVSTVVYKYQFAYRFLTLKPNW